MEERLGVIKKLSVNIFLSFNSLRVSVSQSEGSFQSEVCANKAHPKAVT